MKNLKTFSEKIENIVGNYITNNNDEIKKYCNNNIEDWNFKKFEEDIIKYTYENEKKYLIEFVGNYFINGRDCMLYYNPTIIKMSDKNCISRFAKMINTHITNDIQQEIDKTKKIICSKPNDIKQEDIQIEFFETYPHYPWKFFTYKKDNFILNFHIEFPLPFDLNKMIIFAKYVFIVKINNKYNSLKKINNFDKLNKKWIECIEKNIKGSVT